MENSRRIIDWILSNSELLDLKAEKYTGLEEYLPNFSDIGIFIKINGEEFYGRGTDAQEDIAFLKAFSEAIERSALKIFKIENTNGLAVHVNLENAKENARQELLERDAFFSNFLLGNGLKELTDFNFDSSKNLFLNGIHVKFYEMCRYAEGRGVLCVANGERYKNPFGVILGSSFKKNLEEAVLGAYVETLRPVSHLLKTNIVDSLSEEKFSKLDKITFVHHGNLALDLEYAKKFTSILSNGPRLHEVNLNASGFEYEVLDMSLFPIENIPLKIVKAKNLYLQDIFLGKTELAVLNLKRLKEYNGELSLGRINYLPHPFN